MLEPYLHFHIFTVNCHVQNELTKFRRLPCWDVVSQVPCWSVPINLLYFSLTFAISIQFGATLLHWQGSVLSMLNPLGASRGLAGAVYRQVRASHYNFWFVGDSWYNHKSIMVIKTLADKPYIHRILLGEVGVTRHTLYFGTLSKMVLRSRVIISVS